MRAASAEEVNQHEKKNDGERDILTRLRERDQREDPVDNGRNNEEPENSDDHRGVRYN